MLMKARIICRIPCWMMFTETSRCVLTLWRRIAERANHSRLFRWWSDYITSATRNKLLSDSESSLIVETVISSRSTSPTSGELLRNDCLGLLLRNPNLSDSLRKDPRFLNEFHFLALRHRVTERMKSGRWSLVQSMIYPIISRMITTYIAQRSPQRTHTVLAKLYIILSIDI